MLGADGVDHSRQLLSKFSYFNLLKLKTATEAWSIGPFLSSNLIAKNWSNLMEVEWQKLVGECALDPDLWYEEQFLMLDMTKANACLCGLPFWNVNKMVKYSIACHRLFKANHELIANLQPNQYVTDAQALNSVWAKP